MREHTSAPVVHMHGLIQACSMECCWGSGNESISQNSDVVVRFLSNYEKVLI